MESFLSCFACGDKGSGTVEPVSSFKPIPLIDENSQNISYIQDPDDQKSRSTTTITFRTTETAPSKNQNDQQFIKRKVQAMKKLSLIQRKAMQSQYIKQNLQKDFTVYLVEKSWSEQYTKFLKDTSVSVIRQIDNRKLVDENGNLRCDLKMREDYFIITQKVWKLVYMLYGGGPVICRNVFFPVYNIFQKKQEIPLRGIQNPLNLCYMISVVQCLLSIQQIAYYFHKRIYIDASDSKKKPYHNIIAKLVKQALNTEETSISIKQFAAYFESKFNPYEQHDTHEFLLYLFDHVQEQMNAADSSKIANNKKANKDPEAAYTAYFLSHRSIIDKAFAGQQQSTVLCSKCLKPSVTYIPFLQISLQLVDSTLEGCMKKHFSAQKLDDLYDCQSCKNKTKAQKQTFITKTPNFLIIALKKFASSGKKIEERVKYPYQLDIKKFCKGHHGQTKYNLLSFIVHKGTRSNKGHYYCYTRRNRKDWYYCNDDSVKRVQTADVVGRDAYILFYERIL